MKCFIIGGFPSHFEDLKCQMLDMVRTALYHKDELLAIRVRDAALSPVILLPRTHKDSKKDEVLSKLWENVVSVNMPFIFMSQDLLKKYRDEMA